LFTPVIGGNMVYMELYQLRTFVTVAETGNLTQASERLFTSQPAVSAHIKALEQELDIVLFERTARGMRLTDKGMVLREHAQQVLDSSHSLKNKAKSLQSELPSVLRIGLNSDTQYLRLGEWHSALISQHPHLKIELSNAASVELLKQVKKGELDATFFSGDSHETELAYIDLFTTEAVVAGAPKYAEALEEADAEQLAQLPWIQPEALCLIYHRAIDDLFEHSCHKPQNVILSATEDSTLTLVRAGAGLAFIRDDEAQKLMENGQVVIWPKKRFSMPLRFGYLGSRSHDVSILALLDIISSCFKPLKTET
jgi:DNA-binding transcriptional LysR family regulator